MDNIKVLEQQAEAQRLHAEAQRLALSEQIQKLNENAKSLQETLTEAIRRRDAGENYDVEDVAPLNTVQVPTSHTIAFNPAQPAPMTAPPQTEPPTAPLGMAWPSIANATTQLTKAQRADLASAAEKEAFRATYASKVRQKTHEMELKRKPSIRRRTVKQDAEDLVGIGISNMAHEDASKIREDLRMILTDGVRVLHVRYLQENHMELVTPRHQEQALKNQLMAVGFKVMSGYSALSLQVRRELDEEKRARRNAYCAAKAIERALKGNLGRSVNAYYEKLLAEVKGNFPVVFTDKGQAEFDLEYGVRPGRENQQATAPRAKSPITKARDNCVPNAK